MKMHHKHKLHFMHIHCEIRCSECELNLCVPIEWLLRILKNCLFASHVKLISNYSKYILNISPSMWLSCKSANFLIYLLLLKVYVHYPSGKKTALITSEVHRSICRTIVGGTMLKGPLLTTFAHLTLRRLQMGQRKWSRKRHLLFVRGGRGPFSRVRTLKIFLNLSGSKWRKNSKEDALQFFLYYQL